MLILILIDGSFKHPQLTSEKFTIDIDAHETVENLKIMITLRYVDLDPGSFDLCLQGSRMVLNEQQFVHQLPREDDQVKLLLVQHSEQCCNLI